MKKKETEKGWVKYYFKRLWWKVLVTAILMGAIIVVPLIWENENKFVSLLLRFDAIAITAMFMTILSVVRKSGGRPRRNIQGPYQRTSGEAPPDHRRTASA